VGDLQSEDTIENITERRTVKRTPTSSTYTAEIKLSAVPIHQLKLRDSSLHGACLVVKKESAMMKHLAVDQTLNIRFHTADRSSPAGIFKSEVRHITEGSPGRFDNHYLVGVKIIERLTGN
jgi:hypothetical protein